MPKFIDITGQKFHRLTAIKRVFIQNKKGTYWLFRCDCGEEKIYEAGQVKKTTGHITKSCGCYNSDRMKNEFGEASFNRLCSTFKQGAKKRNIEFSLSSSIIRDIISRPCYYCGKLPYQVYRRSKKYNQETLYNGIDRVNNSLGYIEGNVVPCCGVCNRMKFQHSLDDFKNQILEIYNHWANSS